MGLIVGMIYSKERGQTPTHFCIAGRLGEPQAYGRVSLPATATTHLVHVAEAMWVTVQKDKLHIGLVDSQAETGGAHNHRDRTSKVCL
jgi:hypothetical protein